MAWKVYMFVVGAIFSFFLSAIINVLLFVLIAMGSLVLSLDIPRGDVFHGMVSNKDYIAIWFLLFMAMWSMFYIYFKDEEYCKE